MFQYQPIIYQPGDNLTTPYHAWLIFEHPVTTGPEYLNARITNLDNGISGWIVQNLPIAPDATPRPIHYRMNLASIADAPFLPERVYLL